MDLRLIIVLVACFACLMPPVYSIKKAKAVAIAAKKGAVLLGAKALVKKGIGAIAAKGLLKGSLAVKGLLAAKGAALKGTMGSKATLVRGAADLGATVVRTAAQMVTADERPTAPRTDNNKTQAIPPPPPVLEEVIVEYTPQYQFPVLRPLPISSMTVDVQESDVPNTDVISNRLSGLWRNLKTIGNFKSRLLGNIMRSMEESRDENTRFVYNIRRAPRIYRLPYIRMAEEIKI